jgi:hypothetical protein
MTKMKKKGIKLFIVALASFLMLVFCIVAAAPDSTLRFIDPTPANYTQEQDFTCGVLAINTHKSIYLPNEAASIGIAVLDNEGHMVCDADVTLTITDPSDNETVLSTGNGLINVSPQCCVYGVTNLPDFYTNYTVGGAGTYVMNLTVTAVTADGTKSITDEFSVQNSVDFDVARDGATRIYPSVPYVMNFTIKANKNYTGLIREYVPASFVITPQDSLTVTTVGDTKILTWTKNLVEGETYNMYYEFDAPDVSPYLFTLGALEIGSFKEVRQWQIASDLSGIIRPNGDSTPLEWTVTGGTGTHASAIDEVVTQPTAGDTNDYVDNANTVGNEDQYAMETISGIATDVQVWVYAKCDKANSDMSIDLYWTGGSATGQSITTSSTVNTWEWASTTYSGLTLGQTELDSLEVRIKGDQGGRTYSVATLYAEVTYTVPTWESYKTDGHSIVWGTVADPYDTDTHVVYMYGDGFIAGHNYHVGYYDANGNKQASETGTLDGTSLSSQYDCTSHPAAQYGTWHAVVFDDSLGSPPETYAACSGAVGYMAEDYFEVNPGAIPEFPTVVTAIAVCMLCAVTYMVMRRRAEKG